MEISIARRVWQALEPIHAFVYFVPDTKARYDDLGLERISQYFASRSAPMGAVDHSVVTATFFNFNPGLVKRAMRDAWATARPSQVLEARHAGVVAAMDRFTAGRNLRDAGAELSELARLATDALPLAGRPLFAGHASLPAPDHPWLLLWHQLTLLREHRGDGHVIALAAEGFSPMDALVTSRGWSKLPMEQLQKLRGWRPEEWAEAADLARDRGWLNADGGLSAVGTQARQRMEALTDRLAMAPIERLGERNTERLLELLAPFGQAVREGGGLPA